MEIEIPELSVVVLVGASGSGKSTFARKHFLPTEIISSDHCRALVADDETDQAATPAAFEVLGCIARKRLERGRLAVIDATNVEPEARKPLVKLARDHDCLSVAIVFDIPERVCHERNASRHDRRFGPHVVRNQRLSLRKSFGGLHKEGFRHVFKLESVEEVDQATVVRRKLWNDKREERGPFDIIGDVHGCCDELETILDELGYRVVREEPGDSPWAGKVYGHPEGRKAIFLGDIVDRGPRVLDAVRIVRNMVASGSAFCLPGNHDVKLLRKLHGRDVQILHGLDRTLAEIEALPEAIREPFARELAMFLDSLVGHYVLDHGRLVVAHAGMLEGYQGRASGRVREFALYGETTGETDQYGLPVRYNWAAEYRGSAMVVYGHTPVPEPEWLNRTINIDTGCAFGGSLTALRYPEKQIVSVPALHTYCEPVRPFLAEEDKAPPLSAQQEYDDVLDADDVIGKRRIDTRLRSTVIVREENATAALEVMSRFAVNPKWLIYLPPTMSPPQTSREPGFLEHPAEAFAHFRAEGVPRVVCEEKHMGSRAVAIVCRDAEVARKRFGILGDEGGVVYTRTGRRFFASAELEAELLGRLRAAVDKSLLWKEISTDWLCLDCELMPWSAKAQELLQRQYAAVGAAGRAALKDVVAALEMAVKRQDFVDWEPHQAGTSTRPMDVGGTLERFRRGRDRIKKFVEAYRQYCWPVRSISDLKLAPFHLLASEGQVHVDRDHVWHMEILSRLCAEDPSIFLETPFKVVDVTDPSSMEVGAKWWLDLTEKGGEGMVVKPLDFIVRGPRGLVQPAVKCRGREYLRIIYGPEYTSDPNLERLRVRSLGTKRSLALREFALGIEALERFVRREPLRRVHECVFGVLALESEPVDPRL